MPKIPTTTSTSIVVLPQPQHAVTMEQSMRLPGLPRDLSVSPRAGKPWYASRAPTSEIPTTPSTSVAGLPRPLSHLVLERNRMHLIRAPGSSSTHMINSTSVYPKQYHNERECHSTWLKVLILCEIINIYNLTADFNFTGRWLGDIRLVLFKIFRELRTIIMFWAVLVLIKQAWIHLRLVLS
jgi:hypothetical protein